MPYAILAAVLVDVYKRQDLLRDITSGDQPLRPGHIVVLHHGHPEPWADLGVPLDELLEAEDQMDDVLCHGIGLSLIHILVGTGASYADVSSEQNQEAIEVLQEVGIMTGDENGNFNPNAKMCIRDKC